MEKPWCPWGLPGTSGLITSSLTCLPRLTRAQGPLERYGVLRALFLLHTHTQRHVPSLKPPVE